MQIRCLTLKKSFTITFITLTFISLPATALTVEEVPNSRRINGGWVTDTANILTPETEAQLNEMISQLEAKNGSEIAVVTVSDTAPSATTKQFATALFNRLKIGKAGQNNGVLFLISTGNRRVEIETGTGLQTILPNFFVTNIIKQQITPRFKQNDYNGGTIAGTKALVVTLQNYQPVNNVPISSAPLQQTQPVPVQTYSNSSDSDWIELGFLLVVILLIILVMIFLYRVLNLIIKNLIIQRQKIQKKFEFRGNFSDAITSTYEDEYALNDSILNTYVNIAKEINCGSSESNNRSDVSKPSNSPESSNSWWSSDNSSSSESSSSSSYESSSSSDYGGGSSSGDGGGDSW
ncbi:TPM domain-containing protein [Ancylothrix sp. C2]|uniref:TPM domain-containing protein n=1 Tax=Ancylothrix sp. D3o TaxID=2953691 RepID=UPI0021BB2398|nr:TPM domain-containing protein [Ancylothrix sp. D3o]MCT7951330.1 TPM domain-containing protein [Ancylothrix sp. D3o]